MGVFIGLRNGLSKVLSELCSIVTALIAATEYAQVIAKSLQVRVPIPFEIIYIVVFGVLAAGSLVAVYFFFKMAGLIASLEFKPPFNNIGGAILGGLQWLLLLGLMSTFLSLIPIPFIQETFTGRSVSGPYLAQSSAAVHHFFVRWIPAGWRNPNQ